MEFEHYEEARKERLHALIAERRKLEEGGAVATRDGRKAACTSAGGSSPGGGSAASADMLEREAKRLEVMRRRQEKELGQVGLPPPASLGQGCWPAACARPHMR